MQSNAAKRQTTAVQRRSVGERVFHAVGYEVVALLITAPIGAWLFSKPLFSMGALAIMLSSIAMVWNIIYNALLDRLWPVSRVARGAKVVRILHGLGFEGGFILSGLPVAAWMLGLTLWQALMVEIGFFLFFLPYTVVYNWVYNKLRARFWARRDGERGGSPAASRPH
ncbi:MULTISPECIES: multidrug/biocide efflux PACE transporter [Symbiopectobacterium]|uniref:multidrug/biocide efflux PACE transporter n=1 Tax=Symbiopectobacterium TaxID=801 RepID=UPI001A1E35F2|nr:MULTISPECIES: multidrug/biocide efflux PACE transporter [Symbiopectobacterium]MBG6247111.1 multidrug/biocide efflux PACE transporter [Candidatus Symbiopectobacterium sp. PLON1]MBT9429125.1 multidrug/biocide efflux PACE transporter [Candidatus Symbiopectobacterium endolongispinus]